MIALEPAVPPAADARREIAILVDSVAAADSARSRFGPDVDRYTFSPSVALAGNARSLEAGVTSADILRMSAAMARAGERLFDRLKSVPAWSPVAATVARLVSGFENIFYRTVLMGSLSSYRRLVAYEADPPYSAVTSRILPGIDARDGGAVEVETFAPAPPAEAVLVADAAADLSTRLGFESMRSIGYRLLTHLSGPMRRLGARTILIPRESALVKEIALELALRGFRLHAKPRFSPDAAPLDPADAAELDALVRSVILDAIGELAIDHRAFPIADAFSRRAAQAVAAYRTSLPAWRRVFAECAGGRPAAILTNHFTAPVGDGLYRVARELAVPHFTVQHGATPEFSPVLDSIDHCAEIAGTDGFFAFSDRMAERANANRHRCGKAYAIGTPAEMQRIHGRNSQKMLDGPILYVSTQALLGTRMRPVVQGMSDLESVTWETRLVREVFDRIAHRVVFKPYRAVRYPDPNPTHQAARTSANVRFFEDWIDLRYVVSAARVIVVAHTASTFHWCVAADRPLVYLHSPAQWPLHADAREALESVFFVFNDSSPSFPEDLRAFLSQPLEAIETKWRERAEPRRAFIERFLGAWDAGAGKRGARIVLEAIRNG